jgi:hypothetical protein
MKSNKESEKATLWSQIHLQKPETKLVVKVFNPPSLVFEKQTNKKKGKEKFSFENGKILQSKPMVKDAFLHHKLIPTAIQFHTYSFGNNGPPTSFERVFSHLENLKDIHLRDILMKMVSKNSGLTCLGVSTFGKFNKQELDYNSPVYYLGFFSHESCWAMYKSIQIWRLGCHDPKFAIYSDPEEDLFDNFIKSKNLSLQDRFVYQKFWKYFESDYHTINSYFPTRLMGWYDSFDEISKFDLEDKRKFYNVQDLNISMEDQDHDNSLYYEDIKRKFSEYFRNCTIYQLRLANINRKPGMKLSNLYDLKFNFKN